MTTINIPITDLHAISIFAGKKDIRQHLNAVAIDKEYLVATNGHYCAYLPVKIPPDQLPEGIAIDKFQCIIPIESVNTFLKGLSTKDKKQGDVSIVIEPDDCRLIKGNNAVLFNPIDATYPDWLRIVETDKEIKHAPIFNWHYLALFQKAADILSGEKYALVSLIPHGSKIAQILFPSDPDFKGVLMPMRS